MHSHDDYRGRAGHADPFNTGKYNSNKCMYISIQQQQQQKTEQKLQLEKGRPC